MCKYQSIDFIKSKILVSYMLFYWHKKIIEKQQMGRIKKKSSSYCRTTNHCKQPQATPSNRLLKRACVEAHRTAWGCSTSSQGHSYTLAQVPTHAWGNFNGEKGIIIFYTIHYQWKRKVCFKGRPWTAWNIAFFPSCIRRTYRSRQAAVFSPCSGNLDIQRIWEHKCSLFFFFPRLYVL